MLESVRTLLRRATLLALVASVSLTVVPAGAFAVEVPVASEQITGKVAFNGGYAEDADVSAVAFSYDSTAKGWDAVAASDVATSGAYTLDLPAAGTYRVGFFDAGLVYADRYFAAASKVESGTDIVVASGKVAAGINDTMTALPEYIISGKVAFVGETPPADGVGVTVYSYNGDTANSLVTRRTKADGTYRIHLPAPDPANGYTGLYRIGFTDFDDVFSPAFYRNASTVASATELTVNTPGTVVPNVNATLIAQGSSRIADTDIYNLGIKLSRERFEDGSGVPVVIAAASSWRDLAVAGPLSHGLGGTLLPTGSSTMSQRILDEIARLGSSEVIIVGGPRSVTLNQEYQLREAGVSVVRRVYGNDAFSTAAQVANEMVNSGIAGDGELQVAVLPFETPAPSVAAGAVFDANDTPVLFTKRYVLPTATAGFIARQAPARTLLVGGSSYISSTVASKIPARLQFSATTPAGVGAKIADFGIVNYDLSSRLVGLVSADKPAEAFVADTYLASKRVTAVSTKAALLDAATKSYLVAHKAVLARVIAVGTPAAFAPSTTAAAFAAIK